MLQVGQTTLSHATRRCPDQATGRAWKLETVGAHARRPVSPPGPPWEASRDRGLIRSMKPEIATGDAPAEHGANLTYGGACWPGRFCRLPRFPVRRKTRDDDTIRSNKFVEMALKFHGKVNW